jgi:hypothetical protein
MLVFATRILDKETNLGKVTIVVTIMYGDLEHLPKTTFRTDQFL